MVTNRRQLLRGDHLETPPVWVKGLKTENGYRTIDLHPALVALLRERRKDALARGLHRDENFVFSTEDGRPLSNRNTARDIEAAAKRAGLNEDGLRPVSAHMLRHTFASRLIALGLDPVEVARSSGTSQTLSYGFTRRRSRTRGEETRWERIAEGTRIAL